MWEGVKQLRIIKNFLWIVLIVLAILAVRKYYSGRNIETTSEDEPQTEFNFDTNANAIVVSDDGLNMRSESNQNADVIKTIPSNTKIEVIDFNGPEDVVDGENGNWYKVKYKNKTGWVWSKFVEEL